MSLEEATTLQFKQQNEGITRDAGRQQRARWEDVEREKARDMERIETVQGKEQWTGKGREELESVR